MSSYASQWPNVPFDPAFKSYYEQFYQISDTPDVHEKYVQQFTKNATLIMGSKTAKGSDGMSAPSSPNSSSLTVAEILALRKGLWEKVQSRRHFPTKIFPFGPNGDEVMLYGTVDYVLKDGRKSSIDWAARGHLVKEGDEVRMDFYQVYLVSLTRINSPHTSNISKDTAAQTANAK